MRREIAEIGETFVSAEWVEHIARLAIEESTRSLRERLERAQVALRDAELLNMAGSDELEWVEQHALAIREAKEGRNVL